MLSVSRALTCEPAARREAPVVRLGHRKVTPVHKLERCRAKRAGRRGLSFAEYHRDGDDCRKLPQGSGPRHCLAPGCICAADALSEQRIARYNYVPDLASTASPVSYPADAWNICCT